MKFCWVTVHVRDMEESLKFYQDIVGLKINRRMKPAAGTEIIFLAAGTDTEVELIKVEGSGNPECGPGISLGFVVDSVDAKIEELQGKQIAVHSGPFQPSPVIRFFFVEDPNGLKIQFVEHIAS
ncbi:MAG: VOC family protein [Deltaproteobacteria bacterium]|nr:VOC family protein [Deltaproteobacteria bacterium]